MVSSATNDKWARSLHIEASYGDSTFHQRPEGKVSDDCFWKNVLNKLRKSPELNKFISPLCVKIAKPFIFIPRSAFAPMDLTRMCSKFKTNAMTSI